MISASQCQIQTLRSLEDFEIAVQLQKEIWNFADAELLPLRLFVVATRIGGQVLGAFLNREMIGFCLALPGLKPDGMAYLHSQMLGIRSQYQNSGIGLAMKLAQRAEAVARNISLIEWVFDPLEPRLAHFNLERLGCIVRRYDQNRYGMSTSPLQQGLPTDRCIAEWWLESERGRRALEQKCPSPPPQVVARVRLQGGLATMRTANPSYAAAIQQRVREDLTARFAQGLSIIGFARGDDGGEYLLGPCLLD